MPTEASYEKQKEWADETTTAVKDRIQLPKLSETSWPRLFKTSNGTKFIDTIPLPTFQSTCLLMSREMNLLAEGLPTISARRMHVTCPLSCDFLLSLPAGLGLYSSS